MANKWPALSGYSSSVISSSSFDFTPKKLPPPTPDRREGRLFPPEQSWKTSRLLNELPADRNNFYLKNFNTQDVAKLTDEMNEETRMSNDEGNSNDETRKKIKSPLVIWRLDFFIFQEGSCFARRDIVADPSLRKRMSQFLVFTCGILKMSHPREASLVRCWWLIRVCSIRISGAPCFSFPSMIQARALSASLLIGRWTDR